MKRFANRHAGPLLALASTLLIAAVPACAPAAPAAAPPGASGATSPAESDLGSPRRGEPAPDFVLPDRAGGTLPLRDLRGSLVVVHFTASWCPYCQAEIDALARLADEYAPRGVKVVLIDVLEKDPAWNDLAQRVPDSLRLLRDADGSVARRYAPPKAQPAFTERAEVVLSATLVIDHEGTIRFYELIDTIGDPGRGFDAELIPVRKAVEQAL
jgi:peroxiredoxin